MLHPAGSFGRVMRTWVPTEVYPLITAIGLVSALGLSVAFAKARTSPDVWWSKHEARPWNITLAQQEHEEQRKAAKRA
ncbi:hypothetical protein M422DRAFT_260164 [Sphaerobolus stellatus SS14]|uniref:Uncharacterized protein n=1 Tax=Sphaerobolus stellatus (strain SS14) TaxID=990650 RepID=A0A0C9URQ3_SPHS4|nr:hypothetical protein M422DRAFT_260164 [Sphaerobolus stellatus SS14]